MGKLPEWRFSPQQLENLNQSITTSEIMETWKKQENGKAPGPNGLPAEYYKALEETTTPHFKKLVDYIESRGEMDSWKEVHSSLIHKAGMERKQIKNYRAISLLNVDYKIYATIWTTRLKKIVTEIIHKDQTGFIPKRKLLSNERSIIDILEYY